MAFAETARLAARIDLEGNLSSGIRGLNGQIKGLSGSMARVGKGVGQVGAGVARAGAIIGTAVVGGLGAAAKAAIDYEDAFAGVRKTVEATEPELNALSAAIHKMATEIPVAATELAAIAEEAGALGIATKDISDFTEVVSKLGVTTNLTTAEAASSLGKIGTILNFTGGEYRDFADILVNLGNEGASVETEIIEITKRFAASGKQAGLSTAQIVAFSSAIASAGAQPEAAGSSLSRLFANLITDTALASAKGRAFAKVTGKSFQDFSKIVKTDTVGAMTLFLSKLKDMGKFRQQEALQNVGITNVRDRNAILLLASTMDENLIPALKNAKDSVGALEEESTKKFATVANSITLLKNNFTEAGITIGEGFAPALGRAAKKLTEFLKLASTKSELAKIGKDIGEAIDGINWGEVLRGARDFVGVMRTALSFAKLIFDAFSALPNEIKGSVAGLLVLNKLSGGLVGAGLGNIVGGLGETIARSGASKIPGVGKLFAQPVFVTNFPPGFGLGGGLGGAAGAAGAAGAVGTGVAVAAIAGAVAATVVSTMPFAERNNQLGDKGLNSSEIAAQKYYTADAATQQQIFKRLGRIPSVADFKTGQAKLPNASGSPDDRQERRVDAGKAQQAAFEIRDKVVTTNTKTVNAIQDSELRLHAAAVAAKAATQTGADRNVSATNAGASTVAGAVRASRPIVSTSVVVNVSAASVTKSVTQQTRYGPGNGSYGGKSPDERDGNG